jgi:hypothetical protein
MKLNDSFINFNELINILTEPKIHEDIITELYILGLNI